jgi:hypothetical protein
LNDLARAIVIAAALLGGALVVRGTFGTDRFDLVPAGGGSVYRLDRLTGSVFFCTPMLCRPLPTIVPAISNPQQPPTAEAQPRLPSQTPAAGTT